MITSGNSEHDRWVDQVLTSRYLPPADLDDLRQACYLAIAHDPYQPGRGTERGWVTQLVRWEVAAYWTKRMRQKRQGFEVSIDATAEAREAGLPVDREVANLATPPTELSLYQELIQSGRLATALRVLRSHKPGWADAVEMSFNLRDRVVSGGGGERGRPSGGKAVVTRQALNVSLKRGLAWLRVYMGVDSGAARL